MTLDEPGLSGTSEDSSAPSKPPLERPSRCPKGGQAISLGGVGSRDEIEIGDGLDYAGGYAVAFAHREGAVRKAGVAFFGPEAEGTAHVTDLGVVADDAPAPLLARRSGDVLATVYRAPSGHAYADPTRELTVYVVSRDHAASQGSFVKKADDSTVSDIASDGRDAFVVWDETSPTTVGAQGPGRGVIRGAPVIQTEPGAPARDLSPAESDAEAPRVVPSAAGYSVLWIARGWGGGASVRCSRGHRGSPGVHMVAATRCGRARGGAGPHARPDAAWRPCVGLRRESIRRFSGDHGKRRRRSHGWVRRVVAPHSLTRRRERVGDRLAAGRHGSRRPKLRRRQASVARLGGAR